MEQASLMRLLEEIRNLELNELTAVERAILERLHTAGYSPEERCSRWWTQDFLRRLSPV